MSGDDPRATAWRALVETSLLLGDALERQSQRDAGMPHSYYAALVVLSEAPERTLRLSVLAAQARMSRSRLSHAIRSMESSGWVERRGTPGDGRGASARLTDAGAGALRRIGTRQRDELRRPALAGLSDEEAAELTRLLSQVRSRLSGI